MAEERNLGTARAPETDIEDDDLTKADLQRRMEEARESITQTVTEIKDTVTSQYQNVKETITQSLDWREQYRRRPVAFSVGALGVGALLGYSLGSALSGDDTELPERYYESEGEEDYDTEDVSLRKASERGYAAQAITGGAYGSTAYTASAPPAPSRSPQQPQYEEPQIRPSYSSGYEASPASATASEPDKPSVFERFKETQAYDRLQAEVATLGSRAVEELSKTAQNVVLPALLGKLKDLIGLDLSTQREVAQRSKLEEQTATATAATGKDTPTGKDLPTGNS